ncbi:MAG: hypothetical protein K8H74_18465 [Notoacmeibacter sp.]|nr:hypothetical protein [Notoacmeibacter sp.]
MRPLLYTFTLLALLVRAFVPSGYMLQADASGSFEVVICTENGFETITVDAEGRPAENNGGGQTEHSRDVACPFSLSSVSILAESIPAIGDIAPEFTRIAHIFSEERPTKVEILAINAARAPPTQA